MPTERPFTCLYSLIRPFCGVMIIYLMSSCSVAQSAEVRCAEITFSLSQRASFERQAFDARLTLRNASPLPLTNVKVELRFLDSQLNPVQASKESVPSQARFFYQLLAPNIAPSTVAAQGAETQHWQIIPASGAAIDVSTRYYLAAKVSYTQGERNEAFEVKPVVIIVKPLPELIVDYFLPSEVYGDDPFTDEIEPPVPFMLGVRVINTGASPSIATTIESAQPIIRENKQHLLTQWKLLSTQVGAQPVERRMQVNLGDIATHTARVGRWMMTSQLSGKFVEFTTAIRHGEAQGGELTSVIKQTRQWPLLHDVLDTRAGRDDILDFLVSKEDELQLFSSEGDDARVSNVSIDTITQRNNLYLKLSLPESSDLRYAKIDDPWKGTKTLLTGYNGQGESLPMANIWLSKTRTAARQWHHSINVFLPPGHQETVIAEFSEPLSENSGQISGRVFYDKNGNGLVDKGERGVAKAPVTLKGTDTQGRQWHYKGKADRAGRFSFDQVAAGIWHINVEPLTGFIDGKSSLGTASGHAVAGGISNIALSQGGQVNQLLFAKQAAALSEVGRSDLEIKWIFPPVMAQSYQPWSVMLVVNNLSSQLAKDVRVQMPWPTRSLSLKKNRSWSITQGVLSAHSSYWRQGEWNIGDIAANSQKVLVLDGFMRLNARPQTVSFFAQVGSENLDDNLDNNVAQRTIVVSEYQKTHPLNFNFNQWIEDGLAKLAIEATSKQ